MKCAICSHDAEHPTFTIREMMIGLREEFEYFQCRNCACLQIASIPGDMEKYYGDGYYSLSTVDDVPNPLKKILFDARTKYYINGYGIFGKMLARRFPNYNLALWTRLRITPDTRFLDVGCGTGADIHYLRSAGFTNVYGIDPYIEKTIHYSNGLVIEKKMLDELDGTWDVVNLSHSFEHMPEQLGVLQNIRRLLSDDGIAVISIPTISSYAWETYREHWFQADAPRHFALHSRESFRMLVESAGMVVEEIVSNSNTMQFYNSEIYRKDISMNEYLAMTRSEQRALFSNGTMKQYSRRADELNREGRETSLQRTLRQPPPAGTPRIYERYDSNKATRYKAAGNICYAPCTWYGSADFLSGKHYRRGSGHVLLGG